MSFDPAGYNMVKHSEGHKVIDWEYACVSDPRLDLAITIGVTNEKPLNRFIDTASLEVSKVLMIGLMGLWLGSQGLR